MHIIMGSSLEQIRSKINSNTPLNREDTLGVVSTLVQVGVLVKADTGESHPELNSPKEKDIRRAEAIASDRQHKELLVENDRLRRRAEELAPIVAGMRGKIQKPEAPRPQKISKHAINPPISKSEHNPKK